MTGTITEESLAEARAKYDEHQQGLDAFGGGSKRTRIAVVREPNDTGILDVTDEWEQDLGMPREALQLLWKRRSEYQSNSAIEEPHNRAYDDLNINGWYYSHLHNDEDAEEAFEKIVSRVRNGEDITLVCFEDDGEYCHRHLLVDLIEERLDELPRFDIQP